MIAVVIGDMKRVASHSLALFLILICRFALAGSAIEPVSAGEWSAAINGVRGRLLFGEGEKVAGTRMGVLYLELQNVSAGDTMYVYYDASKSPLRCQLVDSAGKTNASQGAVYDGWIPAASWLALPHDSALRFRVTLGGFGVPQNGGLFVAGCIPDCWAIPPTATSDYFLSGTLVVAAPKGETRPRVWEGMLSLPRVRLPVKIP